MSLKDALEAASGAKVTKCTLRNIILSLDKEDADALKWAIDNPILYPSAKLATLLKEQGYPVGETTVRRHRRKECEVCLEFEGRTE